MSDAAAIFRGYLDHDLRDAGHAPTTDAEATKAYQQSLVSDQVCWIVAERDLAEARAAIRDVIEGYYGDDWYRRHSEVIAKARETP